MIERAVDSPLLALNRIFVILGILAGELVAIIVLLARMVLHLGA